MGVRCLTKWISQEAINVWVAAAHCRQGTAERLPGAVPSIAKVLRWLSELL